MTDSGEPDALERRIRALLDAGEKDRAATVWLEGYGREVLGFLIARLRDRDEAAEVFSRFTEELWKGLDGFRGDCSARAWSYMLARRAAGHYVDSAQRRRAHNVPLSRAGPLSEIAAKVRTATLAAARTESRSRVAKLRESLPIDDQTLIILRVDRKLGWREIAHVMADHGETLAGPRLDKEAVRLRKRYQLAKEKLRRMAIAEGLVSSDEEG